MQRGDGEHSGWITIDTPGTQAFVGFAEGQSLELGDVTIAPECYYGAIYVSALGREDTLASAGKLLVTALVRCRNTGQKLNAEENGLEEKGKGPILMEPVKATIFTSGCRMSSSPVVFPLPVTTLTTPGGRPS